MTSAAQQSYERDILRAVTTGLHARIAGRRPQALGSAGQVAERMLATVPAAHPWEEQIGPFYDTPGVVSLLGVSKQAVADRARRRTLLAASTAQGRLAYPAWQFEGTRVNPEISRVLRLFRDAAVDGWAVASWFTTPAASLNGATPLQRVRGGDVGPVRDLAADTARRWTR